MSVLLQRIDRLYELDAEPLMFAAGASALLIECRTQIESLQRERDELKAELAARIHNYEYWREYAESLQREVGRLASVTYEHIADEKAVMSLGHKRIGLLPGDTVGGIFGTDLLGEHGGMGDE